MSHSNEDTQPQHGGYSLSGQGPTEPLPAEWARSAGRGAAGAPAPSGAGNGFSSSNRIGRIGGVGGGGTSASSAPRPGGRFATLRDIAGSSASPMGPGPGGMGGLGMGGLGGDDDDEEAPEGDENDGGENWYAGGERSGISIENPERRSGNNVVRDILRKAAEAGAAPQPPAAPSGPFSGAAYTLGSDEVDSSYIADPNEPQGNAFIPPTGNAGRPTNHIHSPVPGDSPPEDQDVATRHITFWRNGFSVEDGPLLRYDEPANSQLLDEINTGHAPPQILNVRVGQPVELRVTRRLNEDYVPPPKRPIGTFEGQGHRLGAVVPDIIGTSTPPSSLADALNVPAVPGAFPTGSSAASAERSSIQTHFEVDRSLPTTSVQVRLADGTRLVARMNLHHTVGDIRNFINASRPGSSMTPYTIQTTFPNRILEDVTQTIEQAGLKNSVVVQRLV